MLGVAGVAVVGAFLVVRCVRLACGLVVLGFFVVVVLDLVCGAGFAGAAWEANSGTLNRAAINVTPNFFI